VKLTTNIFWALASVAVIGAALVAEQQAIEAQVAEITYESADPTG